METKARYTIVGLFTLAVVFGGFGFIYWLHGFASPGASAVYRIRFDAPVIGLKPGVEVLFNGLRVGQVTSVRFDPQAPRSLMAGIAVDATTPVGPDTEVGIDAESLLGGATVSLTGGVSAERLKPDGAGEAPLLIATAEETRSLTGAAKAALSQLDAILTDDAKPLHGVIDNIAAFAAVLGRNSGRVDNILAGLEKMTGGGTPAPPPISYNLAAPEFPAPETPPGKAATLQIALPEPTALVVFDTQKVLVAPSPHQLEPLKEGQSADSVPRLVQLKMVDSLENAGFAHVARTMDGFTPEVQLLLEIRSFEIVPGAPAQARIEIFAKWLAADGKITAQRSFAATAPATALDGPAGAAALNEAFQTIAKETVAWARQSCDEVSGTRKQVGATRRRGALRHRRERKVGDRRVGAFNQSAPRGPSIAVRVSLPEPRSYRHRDSRPERRSAQSPAP
jgi:phospholipid/cholesterol/gamma-HCH transport system substrate-binding protein